MLLLKSKEAGIKTLVALDDQGGKFFSNKKSAELRLRLFFGFSFLMAKSAWKCV